MSIWLFFLACSIISRITVGFDVWDILYADVTCCPNHANSESGCLSEAGSSCVYVSATADQFLQDLATAEGSNCLGEKFVECKVAAGDIDACCAPGCTGTPPNKLPPNAPSDWANQVPPNCGPLPTPDPTTRAPTPQPTSACELGRNYLFEGSPCIISGDPHTRIWNNNNHDFQGTPAVNFGTVNDPVYKNQFYYISRCNGANSEEMPIQVLGTHYHWGTRSVSGIDYLTIILTENAGTNQYYLYFSSGIAARAVSASTASTDYDNNLATDYISLTAGVNIDIGQRFTLVYSKPSSKQVWGKITIDGTSDFTFFMSGQTYQYGGRYRMHYVQMSLPSSVKCYACGLCGDFKRPMTGLTVEKLEACDGSLIDYRAGWNAANTPEAFDQDGWTWERNFVDNSCQAYDVTDNIADGANTDDPCDAAIQTAVDAECLRQVEAQETCCDQIGGTFCADLLTDCSVDACAGANGDDTQIEAEVTAIITDAILAVCNIDELQEDMDNAPEPLLECPAGSVISVGADPNYNDIGGCGLDACDDRYAIDSIEDCEAECRARDGVNGATACLGFSWAPFGGDQNHVNKKVCTLYGADIPTSSWGPNQVFCKVQRSCSLKSFTIGDDETTVTVSTDGGASFNQINYLNCWHCTLETDVAGITANTILRFTVANSGGGPGGFVGTIQITNDQSGAQGYILTNEPLTNFELIAGTDDGYYTFGINGNSPWKYSVNTQTDPDINEQAVWRSVAAYQTSTFELDFDRYDSLLSAFGCYAATANRNEQHKVVQDRNTFVYQKHKSFEAFQLKHNNGNDKIIQSIPVNNNNGTNGLLSNGYVQLIAGIVFTLLFCVCMLYVKTSHSMKEYEPLKGESSSMNPFREYSSFNHV